MNPEDRAMCKKIIRGVILRVNQYNKYYVITSAEKRLAWEIMTEVLDNLPLPAYRKCHVYDYCDAMISRILNV